MFKTLSVAETNYNSDKIAFEHNGWHIRDTQLLRVEVSSRQIVFVDGYRNMIQILGFTRSDLKSLIISLQEAEVFLSEAELVEKLMGKI